MKVLSLHRPKMPNLGFGPQVLALILLLGLAGAMAIEPTRQLLEQRDRIDTMVADLNELDRTNDQLQRRIERLQDPDFIEQLAREQAGLVRPGEVPFLVMPPSRQAQAAERQRIDKHRRTQPLAPPEPGLLEGFLTFVGL